MKLILLGPPGAGKGTQAQSMTHFFQIPQVSTGDILRSEVSRNTKLGKEAKAYMDAGELVPDNLIIAMVEKRIAQEDCQKGFLLDGFPRTSNQAEAITAQNIDIDAVIELKVPDKDIVQRLGGRRVHPASGRSYHIIYNPPQEEGKDDVTGEELVHRVDDQEETILLRLQVYAEMTSPLIAYYKEMQKQDKTHYFEVDGTQAIDDIGQQIVDCLHSLPR
jgi:adenylate kinase